MKNNIKRKDNIKSVTLVIDAYDDRKLDTYSMRSKEQVDEDMKMYYHILRNLHNKE